MLFATHDMAYNKLYSGCAQKYVRTDSWPQPILGSLCARDVPRSPSKFPVRQVAPSQKYGATNLPHDIQNHRMQRRVWISLLAETALAGNFPGDTRVFPGIKSMKRCCSYSPPLLSHLSQQLRKRNRSGIQTAKHGRYIELSVFFLDFSLLYIKSLRMKCQLK